MLTRSTAIAAVCLIELAIGAFFAEQAVGQSFFRAGSEFNAVRQVKTPAEKAYTIVVVEFLHHGEIDADGRNVVVAAQNKELVPLRILQLGPGDFCRLAFQTVKGQSEYGIFYGGQPPRDKPPAWTCQDGLLLETRQLRPCNFRSTDSVRNAFDAAAPIGADYVDNVFQGCNPCDLKRQPFLSRYTGSLNLEKAGTYGFITSSQDCSFLLIDGKQVAAAPGYHGPAYRAFRGSRHDVQLAAGPHKFEYDHAASGANAVMVAAWEINPTNPKPSHPTLIPPEVFNSQRVGHLQAGGLTLRSAKQTPDFDFKIVGDAPLPDNDVPLVDVVFRDQSPKALATQAKLRWDFGDGQTSDLPGVHHIYLRPGLYTVTLSIRRGGRSVEIANRVYIDRPLSTHHDKPPTLDECLRIVEEYNPKTLDAASLRQLALTFEAKALALANRTEDTPRKPQTAEKDAKPKPGGKRTAAPKKHPEADSLSAESNHYWERAVDAGRVAFADDATAKGDAELLRLAQLIGPIARFQLGDALSAGRIWRGAASRIASPAAKAECETEAADIAINDLAKAPAAKTLLEAATKHLGNRSGPVAAELHRVWGDYYAAVGDGKSARKEYLEAQQAAGSSRSLVEQTAWLGAHARSTEEFLKEKQYVRAIEELRAWQREFPADKLDGYWTLLFARYWAGREKYAEAIAQAEQLQAVNPDSPYNDQLLYLAADCEMHRGRKDRAVATLHSLLKDYPGSPLAPKVKKQIEMLEHEKE
jgi:tetratricopeptide (TPR) repeat protein